MNDQQKNILLGLGIFSAIAVALHYANQTTMGDIPVRSNPRKGGWDKKKIAAYNRATGAKLKHGVNYDPITLEDFKRKGSWAVRHYKRKDGWQGLNMAPLTNEKGELLPFSTQAVVWGEKPPKTRKDQKRLVKLGEKLLKVYQEYKAKGYKNNTVLPLKIRKRFKKSLRKK
jgi:hypothetical protein